MKTDTLGGNGALEGALAHDYPLALQLLFPYTPTNRPGVYAIVFIGFMFLESLVWVVALCPLFRPGRVSLRPRLAFYPTQLGESLPCGTFGGPPRSRGGSSRPNQKEILHVEKTAS